MIGSRSLAAGIRALLSECLATLDHMSRSLTPVNRVGVDERAAALGRRSIKTTAKREGIQLATSMIDLTTLEGCGHARQGPAPVREGRLPGPDAARDPVRAPPSASIPALVGVAAEALRGTGVAVASVSTGFPAGQTSLDVKVEETREAVAAGATEIDMVISREAYLAGDDARVAREIEAVKEACGDAHLKVILETAELPTYAHVRHASELAITAGADVIKTSTGKSTSGATPGVVLVMLEIVREHLWRTGRVVGVKAAGGVSNTKAALHMLVLVKETLGDDWLTPERFRIGASSLLNDLLMQYAKLDGGHYGRAEDFSKE